MTTQSAITRALLALAEHHDVIPADARDAFRGALLLHLDDATSQSYIQEAVEHLEAADDIRYGRGDWRTLLARYLDDEVLGIVNDRTGREDALELAAAERVARVLALAALEAAVHADLAALVRSQMDEAAELIDVLSLHEPAAAPAVPTRDPFAVLEQDYRAEDAFDRSPHGLETLPRRTSA
jgi:hypothetical protein